MAAFTMTIARISAFVIGTFPRINNAEMKVIEKDLEKKEFTVKNKHLFTDLSEFDLKWTVTANGKEIESGIIDNLSVPPLSSKDITVPFSSDNLPNAECIITFSFLRKNKERYCECVLAKNRLKMKEPGQKRLGS